MKKVLFFLAAMLMIPMVHAAPQFKEGVNYGDHQHGSEEK